VNVPSLVASTRMTSHVTFNVRLGARWLKFDVASAGIALREIHSAAMCGEIGYAEAARASRTVRAHLDDTASAIRLVGALT
jgi:hypothetical protein